MQPNQANTIAVGSLNPVKVAAVQAAASQVWAGVEVAAIAVPSGVADQPTSDQEAMRGALNRARAAQQSTGADFGFGLEGCTVDTDHGMFVLGWAAVSQRGGGTGLGSSGSLLLPETAAAAIRRGEELGPVMDRLLGAHNLKQHQGTVGALTGGRVSRKEAFERAVLFALAKWISPDQYR